MSEEFSVEASFSRIPRHTLADQVYADIKELILSGGIAPGEKLTLRRLAAAVGTSPMPVRDAVSRLVAEKALELLPNRSIQVSWPSKERFEEIVLLRCTIEGLAAELACDRRTEEELAEIKRHADLFEYYANLPEPNAMEALRANRTMHFTIYKAAAAPTLLQMIEALWIQVGPVFWATVSSEINAREKTAAAAKSSLPASSKATLPRHSELLDTTYKSHADLVEAIAVRDREKAKRAVIDDIEKAGKMILRSGRLYDGGDSHR